MNPATGTYEMRAEIANADGALRPGQFVRVELKGAVRKDALAVPQVAVLDGPQGKFVYVTGKDKDGKDVALVRPVQLGDWVSADGANLWIVDSGLKTGDTVIVDGVARAAADGPIQLGRAPGAPGAAPADAARMKGGNAPVARTAQSGASAQILSAAAAMFSRFFIDRPIFAAVISVIVVLAGLAAMRSLPIAQYPEIAPPVVTVQAVYPGASADVIEQTVAAPLENAINGVEGMLYMSSQSNANGVTQIQVTFEIGTNVDQATINVSNRAKQVEPRLPLEVRRQGVNVERGIVVVPAGAGVLLARRPLRRSLHVELRDAQRA